MEWLTLINHYSRILARLGATLMVFLLLVAKGATAGSASDRDAKVIGQQQVIGTQVENHISVLPWSNVQLAERHYRYGVAQLRLGRRAKAIEQFKISLLHQANNPVTSIALAKQYYARKEYSAAVDTLRDSFELNPNHRGVAVQLAHSYSALRRHHSVIQILSNVSGSKQIDPESDSLLAYAYLQTGQFHNAIALYNKLLQIHPDEPVWRLGKAIGFEAAGDYVNALIAYADLKQRSDLSGNISQFVNKKIVRLHERQDSD